LAAREEPVAACASHVTIPQELAWRLFTKGFDREFSKDFDADTAKRGDVLFSGKAKCNNCHVEPLWTEPGWNLHTPEEVCTDDFQANRAPDHRYRTSPLAGIFTHKKGGFYHDGRFRTLTNVVDHYDSCLSLALTSGEKNDLIQYLLSLTFGPQGSGRQSGKSSSIGGLQVHPAGRSVH
jgi:CxxC motif-containing protein (DUF1111 family)